MSGSWVRFQSTRPIRGATPGCPVSRYANHNFNPRAPYGARRSAPSPGSSRSTNFNPRAPYGARRSRLPRARHLQTISIHAPHTGRDHRLFRGRRRDLISIHAPHTGRDPDGVRRGGQQQISIHAPHTGRDGGLQRHAHRQPISIHAPHTGRDSGCPASRGGRAYFNPRAPYGARQQKCIIYVLHFCNNRQSKHKNQQETSSVRTFF